ncbi:high mobility group B protein 7 [Brassica rapa]|uniref:HMG box domain-containing protein n=1 Tax=Brassica campestris TaxID=3711 RepID=M4ECI8_BRACM|nr:high mobility group B protein 7 [Brassica rapa]
MAGGGGGGSSKSNAAKQRKRVEAETKDESTAKNNSNTLLRAKDGSAFARCEGCSKNVAVALISMHSCSLDAKIRVNLEAQVVEMQAEAKKKPVERKKSTSDEPKAKRVRKAKDDKNKKGSSTTSNKPKRPLTAFFIFMNDFRKTFKEENPSSNVKDVAKQGGEKWKSLTEEEKKVYLDKAAELKAEYNKSLESNDADEEEEDEEKQSDDDAEEKKADDANEAEENEVVNKEPDGKEEAEDEILDDY